jgi:hypothetical protein
MVATAITIPVTNTAKQENRTKSLRIIRITRTFPSPALPLALVGQCISVVERGVVVFKIALG